MHALGTSPAHSQVILTILCALPTLESLFAAIRVSKAFHSAYKKHAKQVLHSVTSNFVGPALPLALQVVRHDDRLRGEDSMTEDSENEDEIALQSALKEARTLVENANMVAEWEDLFSFLRKNRRFKTSQLTPLESWRFRKAMYRIMIYSRLFPSDKSAYSVSTTPDNRKLSEELAARNKFLSDCFTNELGQLQVVAEFMAQIIRWVDSVDGLDMQVFGDFISIAQSAGPAVILECYKTLGFEPLTEEINRLCPDTTPEYFEDTRPRPLLSGYLTNSITAALQSRDPGYAPYNQTIHFGTGRECSHCAQQIFSLGLWGETTWDYLSLSSPILGTYLFPSAASFMKGELPRNVVELKHVEALLVKIPFKEIYDDIFNKGLKLPSYPDRNNDFWLCYQCLTKFITDHLHLWVIMKRKEAKEKVADDCWYGYNCRTQVKLHHAQKLNHLCEPKR
ncbi:hypothetical protein BT96DRAFT_625513 [Gymnopus androsaceus JB14]|uniref:Uncharacterized protein n=1 Tax=Gymnopus androsaceus JB14 TaxID=1447944 RepID=A0A6A4IE51_9AGAR|nr:hypothetical protein BT96DRAFT_625513 [Gymnopus androsaceus JB14]